MCNIWQCYIVSCYKNRSRKRKQQLVVSLLTEHYKPLVLPVSRFVLPSFMIVIWWHVISSSWSAIHEQRNPLFSRSRLLVEQNLATISTPALNRQFTNRNIPQSVIWPSGVILPRASCKFPSICTPLGECRWRVVWFDGSSCLIPSPRFATCFLPRVICKLQFRV